jgi:bifunctional DNA-binding transcriptional regulator/antitoxin component of YhaV-PrlF toxin-antitoxin module
VIPKYIRDMLGWERGTAISFMVEGERVVLQKAESTGAGFRKLAEELKITEKEIDSMTCNHRKYAKRFLIRE